MAQSLTDHPRLVPLLIVVVSLGALGIALASEFWGGLAPCVLCLYQRYAYMAAAAVGLAGVLFGARPPARRGLVALAGLAFLAGAGIALFHVGVEQHWWRGTDACYAPGLDPDAPVEALRRRLLETRVVPCDEVPWSLFGVSMAGYNALVSLVLAGASLWAARRMGGARSA